MAGQGKRVDKALILAAGFGTRMRPWTQSVPKPMLPLWNLPLLLHTIRRLSSTGVREIALNLHWRPEVIRDYLSGMDLGPVRLTFSVEREILGTGGALRPFISFFGEAPFYIVNGDVFSSADPSRLGPLLERDPRAVAAAWLAPAGPRSVEIDREGVVTGFRSDHPGEEGTWTFAGITLVRPDIFRYFPEEPFCSLITLFQRAMRDGLRVRALTMGEGDYWNDVGTPERYLQVHGDVKQLALAGKAGGEAYMREADLNASERESFFCVDPAARIMEGCTGRNSVLSGNVTLSPGTELDSSILVDVDIAGAVRNRLYIPLRRGGEPVLEALVDRMGWPVERTALCFLCKRGSGRSFWRLRYGEEEAIGILFSPERPDNLRYDSSILLLRQAGVSVPGLKASLPESHALAIEDLGDCSLLSILQENPGQALEAYRKTAVQIARFHQNVKSLVTGSTQLEPSFDRGMYEWEHSLFEEQLVIGQLGLKGIPGPVGEELGRIAERLLHCEQVVIHRDLQSTNVLFREGEAFLIDTQGMRFGAAAYDLASLLYDPYADLSDDLREAVISTYLSRRPGAGSVRREILDAALQRLVQALGAFGRLASVGQPSFINYVEPALKRLHAVAEQAGYPALADWSEKLLLSRALNRLKKHL